METLAGMFPPELVRTFAVNWAEPKSTVLDYISDHGINVPILLDNPDEGAGCWKIPEDDASLTYHLQNRVGDPVADPPFPIHVVIGKDRRIGYLNRSHQPDAIVEAIQALIAE